MNAWLLPETESVFVAEQQPVSPWSQPAAVIATPKPDFADNTELKKQYGIELGKLADPFKAGLEIFKNETAKALWVASNWLNDPIVIASRDAYAQTLQEQQKPLDKQTLLAKILAFHDEKDINGKPLVDAKERLNALRLYSEVSGFTGKIDINASTNNTVNNNVNKFTKIVLVSPEKEPETIEQASNTKSKMQNENIPSIPLKLVGGVNR